MNDVLLGIDTRGTRSQHRILREQASIHIAARSSALRPLARADAVFIDASGVAALRDAMRDPIDSGAASA
jgi:hypothetical protein